MSSEFRDNPDFRVKLLAFLRGALWFGYSMDQKLGILHIKIVGT